jgi:pimeloyl-ACP methyl ester carboxylesterase
VLTWWGAYWRLGRIRAPTVILQGQDDPLIPAGNARILARRIPGARLEIVPHCSHVMPADAPERTEELVMGFLREQSG